jgi:quercetin dioxygenase-like cupin family protein
MSHFFAEPVRHSLSITRKAHLEGHERGLERVKTIPLNAAAEKAGLVAQMIEFPAGGSPTTAEALQATCGLLYVLEGRLQLESGGMHEELNAGDCASIDSEMSVAWSAAGKERCRVLAVFPGTSRTEG